MCHCNGSNRSNNHDSAISGIDPGLGGAIALVHGDGHLHSVEDMPTTMRGNGRVKSEVDARGIAHLLGPHVPDIAFGIVERVGAMPGQGVAGVFSLGHSFGTVTAIWPAWESAMSFCRHRGGSASRHYRRIRGFCSPQRGADGPMPR